MLLLVFSLMHGLDCLLALCFRLDNMTWKQAMDLLVADASGQGVVPNLLQQVRGWSAHCMGCLTLNPIPKTLNLTLTVFISLPILT